MSQYLSPGVYVEEVPSAVKPIAGVGTSTAGFIGVMPDTITIPTGVPTQTGEQISQEPIGTGDGTKTIFALKEFPVIDKPDTFKIKVDTKAVNATLKNETNPPPTSLVVFETPPKSEEKITADYITILNKVPTPYIDEEIGKGDGKTKKFMLKHVPIIDLGFQIKVAGTSVEATIETTTPPVSLAILKDPPADKTTISADYQVLRVSSSQTKTINTPPAGVPVLCTNFSQFKEKFGDFSSHPHQNRLAHAVYGFFNNGGTRCWVTRVAKDSDFQTALDSFKVIDEIALVSIPGAIAAPVQKAVLDHCENMGDRFAILDGSDKDTTTKEGITTTGSSNYGAIYYPWIQVFDPAANQTVAVPPSGHIAGVYARVDSERGVHKAPANAVIRGALGVKKLLSKADQDGLNPAGINVIRQFNGNTTIWGARTFADPSKDPDLKYINVRRTLLFLRKSIEQGTQWVVFEPNEPGLWAKITRNITAFLTLVWRSGALFGTTPQQAFYVKCDAETNPPELRDLGQVVTEIGVAIVRPAEFVIFRISQWTPPTR